MADDAKVDKAGGCGMLCDRCGGEFPVLQDDPEYRTGMTVQVGGFSVRADDESGDSYDEPDTDQRWFCPECWVSIEVAFYAVYHQPKPESGACAECGYLKEQHGTAELWCREFKPKAGA